MLLQLIGSVHSQSAAPRPPKNLLDSIQNKHFYSVSTSPTRLRLIDSWRLLGC